MSDYIPPHAMGTMLDLVKDRIRAHPLRYRQGADDLSLSGKYVNMARSEPARGYAPLAPRQVPKPVTNPNHGRKFRERLDRAMLEDPEAAAAEWAEIQAICSVEADEENPYLAKARKVTVQSYEDILKRHAKHVPEEDYWMAEVVNEFAEQAFFMRIQNSRGRGGGPVQAATVRGWLYHLIHNICKFTFFAHSREPAGLYVLRTCGLLNRLENRFRWCVRTFRLPRLHKRQLHLDRPALQLIVEQIIESTKSNGRQAGIQTLLGISLCFYGAFRSGSLQANIKAHREQEMYLQIGHCTLNVIRPSVFSLVIDVQNWKGYSGAMGRRTVLTFGPVSKAHNLNFEAPLYFALDLLGRGALEGIETLDQLLTFNGAVVPFKQEFMHVPLLLKRGARGFTLIEFEPLGPHKLSAIIRHFALMAGLPGGSVHAIRRAAADKYAVSMGVDKVLFLLNHGDTTGITFNNHYARALEDTPLVDIQLNEFDGQLSPLELKTLRNKAQATPALNVLIRRSKATGGHLGAFKPEGRHRITKEELEKLDGDPEYGPLWKECGEAWFDVVRMYPNVKAPFTRTCKGRLAGIMKNPTTELPVVVQARVARFNDLNKKAIALRRSLLSDYREQAVMAQGERGLRDATVEERDAAYGDLSKPSYILDQVTKAHQEEVAQYLNSKRRPEKLAISKRDAELINLPEEIRQEMNNPTEVEDEPEPEDEDEEVIETDEPLEVQEVIPVPTGPGTAKISQLNVSLNQPPKIDLDDISDDEDQPEEPEFDDSQEPDALGVDTDVMRKLYARYLWRALKTQRDEQKDKGKTKAKGKQVYACTECRRFPSRADKPKFVENGRRMLFNTNSALQRHMREMHDDWSNLELEMTTDDPAIFVCPECQHRQVTLQLAGVANEKSRSNNKTAAFNHLRKACPHKDKFIPLYKAHMNGRQTELADTTARQDRDREAKDVGTMIEPQECTVQVAEDMQGLLETNPNLFQEWADISKADPADFGGHSASKLQARLGKSIKRALETVPPGSEPQPVKALPADYLKPIVVKTRRAILEQFANNLEDYEYQEGDLEEGDLEEDEMDLDKTEEEAGGEGGEDEDEDESDEDGEGMGVVVVDDDDMEDVVDDDEEEEEYDEDDEEEEDTWEGLDEGLDLDGESDESDD